jgi:hypothetical protein
MMPKNLISMVDFTGGRKNTKNNNVWRLKTDVPGAQ